MTQPLNILVFGAHPDDPDFSAGGVAHLYGRLGHRVKFVSVTNGDAGHHEMGGVELARRRYAETQAVARALGLVEYQVLDNHDGELEPTLPNRRQIIKVIREYRPDLILAPRPNDYHPDHRYTSQLVQDAAYMVTVPNVVSLTDYLRINPVIAYVGDNFQRPYPFAPDVVVDIDEAIEAKLDALHCHTSQVYEWLPYNAMREHEVPADEASRRTWLARRYLDRFEDRANKYRDLLKHFYGAERGGRVRYAEAFEGCEYGSRLTGELIPRLFPFLP
ncbi:MAG: PIG-L family deacetylase [Chloroflexota bacterium]|nr:MAG: PIG-L family deacetylase [Chloroflexota bacterium]